MALLTSSTMGQMVPFFFKVWTLWTDSRGSKDPLLVSFKIRVQKSNIGRGHSRNSFWHTKRSLAAPASTNHFDMEN